MNYCSRQMAHICVYTPECRQSKLAICWSAVWLFILFCLTSLCCVFYCCPVSTGVSPDFSSSFSFSFPLPFAFRKTTHRVRRGQTSLWNNNGVVLGKLPMERPVWKKKRKKNLVLFPILLGNIHQGTPAVWRGAVPSQPQSTHWLGRPATAKTFWAEVRRLGHMVLKRCFLFALPWFFFLYRFTVTADSVYFLEPEYLMLHSCFDNV